MNIGDILRISPRFGIMLGAMVLSICFIITDILSVTGAFNSSLPIGINPFWKLSFVFKCLTDSVILDDFKTALDRLRAFKISRIGSFAVEGSANERSWRNGLNEQHHPWATMESMPSPDGRLTNTKSVFAPEYAVATNPNPATPIGNGTDHPPVSPGFRLDDKATSRHIESNSAEPHHALRVPDEIHQLARRRQGNIDDGQALSSGFETDSMDGKDIEIGHAR